MSILSQIFTWWNGPTIGTRLFTARNGRFVGEDEQGNRFYESTDGVRRWVMYDGDAEASRVSPDWHGWLHHTYSQPPTKEPLPRHPWEREHKPNMTGTPLAYRPGGSLLREGTRQKTAGDYQAWSPE